MRTQPQDIIKQLESDNSRLAKEAVLADAMKEELDEFFEGVKLALDNLIVFGVKQVPVKEEDAGQGLPWTAFVELADALRFRAITGNEAKDAIKLAMDVATQDQWNNWYRRILIKDLRCGVTEKTVNTVVKKAKKPQYKVPVFDVQLATDGLKHDAKMVGKKILDNKLDGCLSEDWVVELEDGNKITIKEVVDNRIKGKVKSFNTKTGKIEFNEIIGWAVDGEDDNVDEYEWFVITLENGVKLPPLTGNHLVYLPKKRCYRRADLLTTDDYILMD